MRFVAFLRAINVGGRVVKMEPLRKMFEALRLSSVETFIASGNVIFESRVRDAKQLERKIESHLQKALGYEVATFIRSSDELAAIARYQPFPRSEIEADGHSLYIGFLPAKPSREAQQKLMKFRTDTDEFHVHGREIYWLARQKFSESSFSGALLEKTLGMPATLRRSTTVQKLAAKYPAA